MLKGLIIGLRITADQQRPEQTGGRRCETLRTGENDNSREKCEMFVETAGVAATADIDR